MTSTNRKQELTYEIIKDAKNGNRDAVEFIMNYYEAYIIQLSKVPYCDDRGEVKYYIDEDLYMTLKLRLQEAIQNTNVA